MSAAEDLDGIEDAFPVSAAQKGMLFHSLAEPGSGVYLGIFTATLSGGTDLDRFTHAWGEVFARHQALRSFFVWEDLDEPVQVVRETALPDWTHLDFRADPDPGAAWDALLDRVRTEGLDLSRAPVARHMTVAMPGDETRFLWVSHHALLDDWSVTLLLSEVTALCRGEALPEPGDPTPARTFADWLASQEADRALRHWRGVFRGFDTPCHLPLTASPPDVAPEAPYLHVGTKLPDRVADRLKATARKLGTTPATLAIAVWALVLARVTGTQDVAFGLAATLRGPDLPGIDSAIGNYVTTLPHRAELQPDQTLAALIRQTAEAIQTGRGHEALSLGDLQQSLDLPAGTAPFDTILSVKQSASHGSAALRSGEVFENTTLGTRSNFKLAFLFSPDTPSRVDLLVDPNRSSPEMAETLLAMIAAGMAALPDHLERPALQLPLMSEAEAARIASRAAGPALVADTPLLPVSILARAAEHPDAPAAQCGEDTLSYGALSEMSAALAGRLIAAGVSQGDRVAIVLDRGCDFIWAILGVMRAGAAYVPIDPSYPENRIAQMLQTARPRAIVTDRAPQDLPRCDAPLVAPHGPAVGSDLPAPAPDDPAYVIFTSGSTGAPKGVVISHANLAASNAARVQWYGETPERYLLLPSFSFDSSVAGIFWTLAGGGTLILPEPGEDRDPQAIAQLIAARNVSHTLCLPSLYDTVLDGADPGMLDTLATVIVAGEETSQPLIDRHRSLSPGRRLVNEYGPTEATVWASAADLGAHDGGPVPIGAPIPGMTAHVCDANGHTLPNNVPGELYLSGPGIAQGYLGREEETAKRFVPGPGGVRAYRTGDLVSRCPDGRLLFLGRVDRQIKIRGHRIELAEIEAVLGARPDVRETALLATGPAGRQSLTAFVVPEPGFELDPAALRAHLEDRLPDWMVPSRIAQLAELPRTSNGKLDRNALPDPGGESASAYVPPATSMEAELAQIWQKVLWIDRRLGVTEDFFDLGGHSLLSMKLVNAIRAKLNLSVPVARLGRITTVREQARLLDQLAREVGEAPTPAPPAAGSLQTGDGALAGLTPEEMETLRGYLASWPPPVLDGGLIRGVNLDGTLPPLFFWFIGEQAFTRLARALGPDQPIYAMRAGQGVVDVPAEDLQWAAQRRLALSYVNEILALHPDGPFYLGGECQGGTVALHVAHLLTGMRKSVGTVILLEKTPPVPYPGHVSIIFTRQGFLNPNRRFAEPERAWNRFYKSWTVDYLDGGYLDWFDHVHTPATGEVIRKRLAASRDRAPVPLPPDAYRAEWLSLSVPAMAPPGQPVAVTARVRNVSDTPWQSTSDSGIRLTAQWILADETPLDGIFHGADLPDVVRPGDVAEITLTLPAPPHPGTHHLSVDLAEEGVTLFSGRGSGIGRTCLEVDPNAPAPWATTASEPEAALLASSDPEGGAAHGQAPVTQAPVTQARANRLRGQPRLALETLERAGTESRDVLRELGLSAFETGEDRAAMRHLRAAIVLDPEDAEALIALGRLHLKHWRLPQAVMAFERASRVATDPVLAAEARNRLNLPRRWAAEARRVLQRVRVGRDVRNDPGTWADDEEPR